MYRRGGVKVRHYVASTPGLPILAESVYILATKKSGGAETTMIQVDLRAAIIPPETRAWRLFPGKSYKFLRTFDRTSRAFLDYPGLELPEGDLAEAEDWIPRIAASEQIIDLKRELGPDHDPDIDLADFQRSPRTRYRSVIRQSFINLFQEARHGDYIIVPSSLSEGQIRIGQFARQRGRSLMGRFE